MKLSRPKLSFPEVLQKPLCYLLPIIMIPISIAVSILELLAMSIIGLGGVVIAAGYITIMGAIDLGKSVIEKIKNKWNDIDVSID